MREAVALWLILLLVVGCGSTVHTEGESEPTTDQPEATTDDEYDPRAQIGEVHTTVVGAMVEGLLEDRENLAAKHGDSLRAYIATVFPQDQFVQDAIENFDVLREGFENEEVRQTEEYESEFRVCINVAVQIAMMRVDHCIGVYMRKNVYTDELTAPLFAKSETFDDDVIISWIHQEVTVEAFREGTEEEEFDPEEGDVIYTYTSPAHTWEWMCGRSGYAVFRDGKLVKTVTTLMN